MWSKPSSPESRKRVVKHAEEEVRLAFSELAAALIDDPNQRTSLVRQFWIRVFDIFSERYQTLVTTESDLGSWYLPKLARLAKRVEFYAEKWLALHERLWPEHSRVALLASIGACLVGRGQYWHAMMMKQLRESPPPGDQRQSERPPGCRAEIQAWMKRKGIENLDNAARRLGLSKSALKSIMSDRGKPRYGAETLKRVLDEIKR
jgi:lambda repressor-like predicted transcriptional regulator